MRFIIPKGRLMKPSLNVLSEAGIKASYPDGRSLLFKDGENEIVFTKPADVPTYVERTGDIGISGNDITEETKSDVFIPMKLDFGICRMMVAVPIGRPTDAASLEGISVATKYPRIAKRAFSSMGIGVSIVKLSGSIEIAPSMGIADAIMDIAETGSTLRENGLVEAFKVMDIQAQVVVNRISLKIRYQEIMEILKNFEKVIKNEQ